MKRALPIVLLALIALLFLCAAWLVVQNRFTTGDIYPAFSTLRPDPIGTKAFFESLQRTKSVEVVRHTLPLTRLARHNNAAIFILGSAGRLVRGQEMQRLEELARQGNRVIIALEPEAYRRSPFQPLNPEDTVEERKKTLARTLTLTRLRSPKTEQATLTATLQADEPLLPTIEWAAGSTLRAATNSWATIYSVDEQPVVVQRDVGLGSIVVFGDSYLFSNEALYSNRQPELLAWAVGRKPVAVFDESHLGVQSANGVMAMIREYRLHGAIIGSLIVFALWFWSANARFLPSAAAADLALAEQGPSGKASHAGFTHLLQRHVPREKLLEICVAEWKKTSLPSPSLAAKSAALEATLARARETKDYVAAYNEISEIVSSKRIA